MARPVIIFKEYNENRNRRFGPEWICNIKYKYKGRTCKACGFGNSKAESYDNAELQMNEETYEYIDTSIEEYEDKYSFSSQSIEEDTDYLDYFFEKNSDYDDSNFWENYKYETPKIEWKLADRLLLLIVLIGCFAIPFSITKMVYDAGSSSTNTQQIK